MKSVSALATSSLISLADEFQRGIAHQGAGQQAGLEQDLEAVADAENLHAGLGLRLDRLHHRHARGDRAAAQIVAVGEAAGNDDQVDVRNLGFRLPDGDRRLAGNLGQRRDHVAVTVEAWEAGRRLISWVWLKLCLGLGEFTQFEAVFDTVEALFDAVDARIDLMNVLWTSADFLAWRSVPACR